MSMFRGINSIRTMTVYCFAPFPPKRAENGTQEDRHLVRFTKAVKNNTMLPVANGAPVDPYDWSASHLAHFSALANRVLIPVPTSKITGSQMGSWPSFSLALALGRVLKGTEVYQVLSRTSQIRKASMAATPSDRPTIAEHIASIVSKSPKTARLNADVPIALVDDVLTRGTQMAAAYEVLRAAGFTGRICGVTASQSVFADAPRDFQVQVDVTWDSSCLDEHARRM
jgi:hypothetical protein